MTWGNCAHGRTPENTYYQRVGDQRYERCRACTLERASQRYLTHGPEKRQRRHTAALSLDDMCDSCAACGLRGEHECLRGDATLRRYDSNAHEGRGGRREAF